MSKFYGSGNLTISVTGPTIADESIFTGAVVGSYQVLACSKLMTEICLSYTLVNV